MVLNPLKTVYLPLAPLPEKKVANDACEVDHGLREALLFDDE